MSAPRHLDQASLQALLENPGAHAELLAHLGEPCEVCEAFLAEEAGPGVLDGLAELALQRLAPTAEAPLDERGFARLGLGAKAAPAPRRRSRWAFAAAGALAAAALLVVVLSPRPDPDDGVKGALPDTVELQVVWRSPEGVLEPMGPGAEVPARGALLFRARSPRPGQAVLMVQRGTAPPEPLHSAQVSAGLEDLRGAGGALGLSLEGEAGRVVVWLVVGGERTAPSLDEAREAVHSGAPNALAVGRFEIFVKP